MDRVERRVNRRTVRSGIARLRQQQREARKAERRYDGGLPAEISSLDRLRHSRRKRAREKRRALLMGRAGRRIDLAGLLRQRRNDGAPVWTLADPAAPIDTNASHRNGTYDSDGQILIGSRWKKISGMTVKDRPRQAFSPLGMPALPERVRRLATDPAIRRRANWVGVLYQPDEWQEVEPDPALVVEWKARPGEYYALAVWGHDGPRIMEFVD